ncbi:hypothetical protein TRAPUB_5818 [Trametes pubescens]|uniref:Uncharacterized protein n=1 Tax=Trametes pubescens TaxID=154538 RepID=A0A1M2V7F4_TRAPU|nr:hypothetical protein TRAPUB_5818 [Trametes pubescens]
MSSIAWRADANIPANPAKNRKSTEKLKNRAASGAAGVRKTGGAETERWAAVRGEQGLHADSLPVSKEGVGHVEIRPPKNSGSRVQGVFESERGV